MDTFIARGLDIVKAQGGMGVETMDIQGVQYHHFPIPYGNDLSPGFAYIDDFLVIGTQSNTIKTMLDVRKTDANILKDQRVITVSKPDQDNNSIAFIDIPKGCDALISLSQWGTSMIGFAGPEVSKKYKVSTEKILIPLLQGLKMYDSSGIRYWTESESIISEIRVK